MMRIDAPWTLEQVESLNGYQASRVLHPFTCRDRGEGHELDGTLYAEEDGWHCFECGYTQDWAWDFMANGAWRDMAPPWNLDEEEPVMDPECLVVIAEGLTLLEDYYQQLAHRADRENVDFVRIGDKLRSVEDAFRATDTTARRPLFWNDGVGGRHD